MQLEKKTKNLFTCNDVTRSEQLLSKRAKYNNNNNHYYMAPATLTAGFPVA